MFPLAFPFSAPQLLWFAADAAFFTATFYEEVGKGLKRAAQQVGGWEEEPQ